MPVNEILVDAAKRGASDIHFDPTEEDLNVRIRIDGELLEYAKVPNFVKKNLFLILLFCHGNVYKSCNIEILKR